MVRVFIVFLTIVLLQDGLGAATSRRKKPSSVHRKPATAVLRKSPQATPVRYASSRTANALRGTNPSGPWLTPTFADAVTESDYVDGEDLVVRRAAVDALGLYNGTVVVADPMTGRVLTIVNQRLALKGGFIPCSTIKLVTALAAMQEGIISPANSFRLSKSFKMDLSEALAHSNNYYFAALGQKLGFERVTHYARDLGLGERAGWDISGEEPGTLPSAPPKNGGVGMMTSFGEGIRLTPLQLASLLGAIANGGSLYHLQYPKNMFEAAVFQPRLKRRLEVAPHINDLKDGMRRAILYGTARRAGAVTDDPVFGKTGTCTDFQQSSHMGWFGSFNEAGGRKLVVVVMLTGAKAVSGPVASGIAGNVYRNLEHSHFLANSPGSLIGSQKCCAADLN